MSEALVVVAVVAAAVVLVRAFRPLLPRLVIVHDHEAGLLYRQGRLVRRLEAGAYRLSRSSSTIDLIDLRRRIATVPGQEVLSSDHVGLKVSVAVVFEVVDPVAALQRVQRYEETLHVAVQLALRAAVSATPIDDLLARRLDLGARIASVVGPQLEELGLHLHVVEVKDVMFPGELKKIFAEVVRAQKEGQASLERVRAETAVLRSLANAARLLDGNPSLLSLRVLQSVEASGARGGTMVLGVPQAVLPISRVT